MSRLDEATLQEAETAHLSGQSLKATAKEAGIGNERLSLLLCEYRVKLRNHSPARKETAQMKRRYNVVITLEHIGAVLVHSPSTFKAHLLVAEVVIRDSHGR